MSIVEMDDVTHIAHQQALIVILREFNRVCTTLHIPYVLFAGTLLGAVRHQGFIPWDDDVDVMMLREDYERFLREADQVLDQSKFFLQKEFSEHWPMFFSKLRLNHTTCLEKYHPKDKETHQGVYMDIFPCDAAFRSHWGRKLQFLTSKIVIAKSLDKRGYDTDSKKKRLLMMCCKLLPMKPFLSVTKGGSKDSGYVHSFLGGASSFQKNVYPRDYFEQRTEALFEGSKYPIPLKYHDLLRTLYGDYMCMPSPEQRVYKQHAILVDLDRSYEDYQNYRDGMIFEVHTRSIR